MELLKTGQLVTSRKGRDCGKKYVVIGFAGGNCVQVADGFTRTVDKPKRKNIKHLIVHQAALGEKPLADRMIRAFIKEHGVEENPGEEGSTSDGQG